MKLPLFNKSTQIHCIHCNTPIDIYEPLKTYSGRCCELYSDILDLVDGDDVISFSRLLTKSNHLKAKYPDVLNFSVTIQEVFDILEDCGIINCNHHVSDMMGLFFIYGS